MFDSFRRLGTMDCRRQSRITIVCLLFIVGSIRAQGQSVLVSDTRQTAVVGDRVVVPCNASLPGPVRWCYHKTPMSECDELAISGLIVPDHTRVYELGHGNDLVIKTAEIALSGWYVCIEDDGAGPYMHRVNLTIVKGISPTATTESDVFTTTVDGGNLTFTDDDASSDQFVTTITVVVSLLAAIAILVILAVVLHFKVDPLRTRKRKHNSEFERLIRKPTIAESRKIIKRLENNVRQDPRPRINQTRDSFTSTLLAEPDCMAACVELIVQDHIRPCNPDPNHDAIVGMHGVKHTGSTLASAVAVRVKLPLILMLMEESGPNDQLVASLQLNTIHHELIDRVFIVDAEMNSGRSMQAADDELTRNHQLTVERRIVVNDVASCDSRANCVPEVYSLFKT